MYSRFVRIATSWLCIILGDNSRWQDIQRLENDDDELYWEQLCNMSATKSSIDEIWDKSDWEQARLFFSLAKERYFLHPDAVWALKYCERVLKHPEELANKKGTSYNPHFPREWFEDFS